jgi:hypothetical protein
MPLALLDEIVGVIVDNDSGRIWTRSLIWSMYEYLYRATIYKQYVTVQVCTVEPL